MVISADGIDITDAAVAAVDEALGDGADGAPDENSVPVETPAEQPGTVPEVPPVQAPSEGGN